jgi:sugar lactone lactonase YvrE
VASDRLVELNLETGDFSVVGSVGTFGFGGLAMAADGFLYGVSYYTDELWRINPVTGGGSRIGPLNVSITAATGLAFDACGALWMFTGGSGRLYEVNPSTGSAMFVRDFGEVSTLTVRGENLLAIVEVSETRFAWIDPRAETLRVFGERVFVPVSTFQQGLDFDRWGRLWAVFWKDGPIPDPGVSSIVRYNPVSGQVLSTLEVPIAQLTPVFEGNLAISPPQGVCGAQVIPASSATGLMAVALLIGIAGQILIRRHLTLPSAAR